MAKVLFIASEMVPYCKSGGLADVAGAFPDALARVGEEVRTVLPFYSFAKAENLEKGADFHIHISGWKVDGTLVYHHVNGVKRYLVHQPHYYHRDGIYGDSHGDFGDNDERFAYLCEAALLMCKIENWKPDIIHINDWQTGILGPILRLKYAQDPFFYGTKIVFTIHNLAYQGWFGPTIHRKFDLSDSVMHFDGMEMHGSSSYLKAGLQYSDFITTVSPTYAWEIQGSEYGCGMENVLQARSNRIFGILNGIDMDEWNPATDPHLGGYNYSADEMGNKETLKQKFLESLGLPFWKHVPLMGIVARFAAQKGIRLLESAFEEILAKGTQIVVLGSGEQQFANSLKYFESKYPRQVRAFIKYDNTLAHLIEAASDYFLMPSRYEPCGLNQMYSLRYGTIPIVFSTGGLADTVFDCDEHPDSGNGYVFHQYSREAFLNAVDRALGLYNYPEVRYVVQQRGMRTDFSWEKSAHVYQQLYSALIKGY